MLKQILMAGFVLIASGGLALAQQGRDIFNNQGSKDGGSLIVIQQGPGVQASTAMDTAVKTNAHPTFASDVKGHVMIHY